MQEWSGFTEENAKSVYIPSSKFLSHLQKEFCGLWRLRCAVSPCVQNAVIAALSSKSWDVETATELLLSNWNPPGCEDDKLPPSDFSRSSPALFLPFITHRSTATVWAILPPWRRYRLDSSSDGKLSPSCCRCDSIWPSRLGLSFHQNSLSRVSQSDICLPCCRPMNA